MSAGLALLCARRAARPAMIVAVAAAAALPLLDGATQRLDSLPAALQVADDGAASTGWIAALVLATAWAAMSCGHVLQRWYDGESAWLAPTRPARATLAAAGTCGSAAGTAALSLAAAAVIVAIAPPIEGTLLELEGVGGPERSLVLEPGERYERTLPAARAEGPERRGRVRLMPTIGGASPATVARVELLTVDGVAAASTTKIVNRRWVELPLGNQGDGTRLVVTNAGDGALAVLGPRPVQIWRTSNALVGGHLRAAALAALWLAAVGALAVAAGAWTTPAIAGLLTASVALFATTDVTGDVPLLSHIGEELSRALAAIDEGRAPSTPGAGAMARAAAAIALATCVVRPALARWRREGRR
ncbi:MAG: hypothetical protein VX015_13720 [Planctomycetota bacterium]|nr:hypothetical protein [Planctomycetota bacterium]